jgi:hypothetical protein
MQHPFFTLSAEVPGFQPLHSWKTSHRLLSGIRFIYIWVYAYLGPSHELLVDQGTEVTSKFFRLRCKEMGIHLGFAPVESRSSLGLVERMYGPITHIYHKLMMEITLSGPRPKALCLAAATRALNDTAGQNGLVPTLLVFGALPNVILDMKQMSSFPSQKDRMSLLSIARDAAETHIAAARLSEAEKHSIPSGDYLLSPGDQVLVFREQHGCVVRNTHKCPEQR